MTKPPAEESETRQRMEKERLRRRNLYLTIGGVVSLILPLLGVAYLRMSETPPSARKDMGDTVFSRRAGDPRAKKKITPAKVPAAPLPSPITADGVKSMTQSSKKPADNGLTQDSLSFIRGGGEYYKEKKPDPPPQAQPKPKPEPKKIPPKPTKKPFVMPKLKSSSGPNDFKSRQSLQQIMPNQPGMPDMDAIMKQATEGN